ncbi:MAG: lysophospholipid acyltransferase family protein [Betaproteobacteria bacterium]|nr:MAG: lysophospholipid acyltransferase family protein [Betaproteobacteria bacterium]
MSRALMRLAARLPLPVLHAAGAFLGWLIYLGSATYRRHLRANLEQAGFRDPRTRRAAVSEAGKLLAELPALWFRPHAEVAALVRSLEGETAVWTRARGGEPIVFLSPHLGCFEVTSLFAATRMPITVLYRPPKLAWLEPLMREGRERTNVRLAQADLSGVREVLAALKRGEAVGFLPDQVPGVGEGEWVEHFGRPAYTMTLAARLASRPRHACYFVYARRLARGRGYALVARALPAALPGESATRRINRAVEALIRECPEQYLWAYNRYKTPVGAPKPAVSP